jgi:hypothetical protein
MVSTRSSLLLVALLSGWGCADAFGIKRQELSSFRIAALGVLDGKASASVWSGEGMGHAHAPLLEWSMDGTCIGEGWDVVPEEAGLLELRATSAGGAVAHAQVTVGSAPDVPEIVRMAVVVEDDLSIEARDALESREVESGVEIGEALRMDVIVEESHRVHFMVAGSDGTVLELDRHRGDFLAEEIIFNDTEVESRTDSAPGVYHLLVLVQDLKGGNRWIWLDAPMGVDGTWARSGERRLELGEEVASGLVSVSLSRVDGFESYELEDPELVTDLSTQSLTECAPQGIPFDLDWIVDGRCGLDELDGARIVLEIE